MKTVAVIVFLLSFTIVIAYSETLVPDSIKDEVTQLYSKNNLNEKTVMSILVDLSNQKIIKNSHVIQQIYSIPKSGDTDFVKISGVLSSRNR
jgi:predicted transcriptional regulator